MPRWPNYGIREDDFKELLLWQRTLLLFIQVRFETGVQLAGGRGGGFLREDREARGRGCASRATLTLEDYRDQIERKLTGQKADQQMDIWLRDVRRRTNVVVHEEVLR